MIKPAIEKLVSLVPYLPFSEQDTPYEKSEHNLSNNWTLEVIAYLSKGLRYKARAVVGWHMIFKELREVLLYFIHKDKKNEMSGSKNCVCDVFANKHTYAIQDFFFVYATNIGKLILCINFLPWRNMEQTYQLVASDPNHPTEILDKISKLISEVVDLKNKGNINELSVRLRQSTQSGKDIFRIFLSINNNITESDIYFPIGVPIELKQKLVANIESLTAQLPKTTNIF
jgi:hypothetical protein